MRTAAGCSRFNGIKSVTVCSARAGEAWLEGLIADGAASNGLASVTGCSGRASDDWLAALIAAGALSAACTCGADGATRTAAGCSRFNVIKSVTVCSSRAGEA